MTNDTRTEDGGFKRGEQPLCLGGSEGAEPPSGRAVAGAMGKEGKPPTRSRIPHRCGIGGVGVQGSPLPRLTK